MTAGIGGNEVGMDCRKVRQLADAYESEQLLVETARAIVAHLDRCPPCREEVDGIHRMRNLLQRGFNNDASLGVSPEFAAALRARLKIENVGSVGVSGTRLRWMALAAAVLLFVSGGFGIRGLGIAGFSAIVHAAVGDHRFCFVAFALAERPLPLKDSSERYADPVDARLDALQPAAAASGDIRIVERHSCVYGGRRFAHVVLKYKNDFVSMVVTPDTRMLRVVPGGSAPADGSIAMLDPQDDLNVAALRGPAHVVFFISPLGTADLRDVAQAMAPAVSAALKGTQP